MRRDVTYMTTGGGRRHRLKGLSRWLAIGLGGALVLALILAQAVRAAGEGINLSAPTLSVDEGHSTSYFVSLIGDKPDSDVVVDITSSNTDVVPSPTSLTFTPANYRTSQPVTLRVANDDDAGDEGATITHAINDATSADSFDEVDDVTLRVVVMDDDDVGATFSSGTGDDAFDPTTAPVKVDEGSTANYTVALKSAPTSNVTVTITSGNTDAVTVTATLTFTPTDFDADTVMVTGVQDDTTNDETVTITHAFASSDSNYNGLSKTVTVTVADDETAGVTFVATDVAALNEGASATYTVVLDHEPTHNVVVRISSDNGDVTPLGQPRTGSALTFTPANFGTEQTVLVEVASDGDAMDEMATLTHAVSSADPNYNSAALIKAKVDALTDDATDEAKAAAEKALKVMIDVTDVNVGVRISKDTVAVTEGGSAGTYTVALQSAPTSDVTVTITSSNTDAVTVTATLTFTSTDFDADTVTVTPQDDDTTNDERVTITHAFASSDSNYNGLSKTVTVTVDDDETAGVTFVATAVEALNEGASATYTVVLDHEPTHDVTVGISSDNPDVTVDEDSLTFTPSDFAAKTVTVMVAADADNMDEMATLTHAVSSADPNYNSAALIKAKVDALTDDATDEAKAAAENALKVMIDVTDVNVGVRISTDTVAVDEGDTSGNTYTVALQSAPTHDVTVRISNDNTDVTVSPDTLTFTPDDFAAKTVTVTAAEELAANEDRSDESATLMHAISSDDLRYNALSDQTVTVNVKDNDPSLTLSATELDVLEGESDSFMVKLAADPDSDRTNEVGVEVKVEVSGSDGVTVEPAELTFTSDNWDDEQTVTVTAVADEDDRDETATVTLTVPAVATSDFGDIQVYIAEFTQTVSILLTEPAPEPVTVPGPSTTVTVTQTQTVTRTQIVEVPVQVPGPTQPTVIGDSGQAVASEVDGRVQITRRDGGPSLAISIGGFIRDASLGQTYQVVRRGDGKIVRQWVSPNSPLVYQIPWAVVNTQFTVPTGVVLAIPLDDQAGSEGQLVRRFDGGDDRIFSYHMGQWRHVPDIPTFQALGLYWCDVTAADADFFNRIRIGPSHPATDQPARADYPSCSTG